jgi:hypothetical protein
MTRRFRTSAVLIAVTAVVIAVYALYTNWQANKQKQEISTFSASIAVGLPKSDAMRACEAAADKHPEWRFRYWESNENVGGLSTAVIESPVTFGAKNWVAWIVFDQAAVAAVLVRTLDSPRERPHKAPRDRVDQSHRSELAQFVPAETQDRIEF